MDNINFIFIGTDEFSVHILDKLKNSNLIPSLIITAPDQKSGRGQKLQKSLVKIWGENNRIKVLYPEKIDQTFIDEVRKIDNWDLSIVASYGKILPLEFLNIAKYQTINIHPSLLPKYRGSSPIESAILDDEKTTGVTIMLMDEKMDHGPILKQEEVTFKEWESKKNVTETLAEKGAELLIEIIPGWINQNIDIDKKITEQNHNLATFTKKITRQDGLINYTDLEDPLKARELYLKIKAYNPWPSVFFDIKHQGQDMRVKIKDAQWGKNNLTITKVIPAGRKEMDYDSFIRGFKKHE